MMASLKPKDTLGNYEILSLLGRGGMGEVYRARDPKLRRTVALKVLPASFNQDPNRKQRLLREARAIAKVSHPAIAQVFDVDETGEAPFIIMEYVEGHPLSELLRNRKLDLLAAVDAIIQISDGLAKAHQAGIVHRDIKPSNILLTHDGHVKILDFGLAKAVEYQSDSDALIPADSQASTVALTEAGSVLGTAGYMSPEQAKGRQATPQSDLFSLGVILYEAVTGSLPFRRETIMDTLQAIAFDEPPPLTSRRDAVPFELQRIVAKCLRKRIEDRYPSAEALSNDLRVLRRQIESGSASSFAPIVRVREALNQLRSLGPTDWIWYVFGAVTTALLVYIILKDIGLGTSLVFFVICLFLYRHIRNRPHRMAQKFVQTCSKLPGVQAIHVQNREITVYMDQATPESYQRIHRSMDRCNQKLFHGDPFTVAIRDDATLPELSQVLRKSGVRFVHSELLSAMNTPAEPPALKSASG